MFLRQLRNELHKMFARKRTYIGFGAFLLVQFIILLLLHLPKAKEGIMGSIERFGGFFVANPADYYGGLTLAVLIIVITFALLGALYIALVGGDIVAKEAEEGVMRMILARPVSRTRLLALKWLACSLYTVALILFLGISALLMASVYRGGLGKLFVMAPPQQITAFHDTAPGLLRYALAMIFLSYSALTISSVAFMFSCLPVKPAAATILTLSVFFIDFILHRMPYLEPYAAWFISHHTSRWVRAFEQPETNWSILFPSWGYLAVIHLICWGIAALIFRRRDLKS